MLDTLYLKDERKKTIFPRSDGRFDIKIFRNWGSYSVEGDQEPSVADMFTIGRQMGSALGSGHNFSGEY